MKTRLNVQSQYAEFVRELGCKYDGRMKSWYVPGNIPISIFNSFIPLSIELVPSSNWKNNVRSEFKNNWNEIKHKVYSNSNYRCEICGGQGLTHPVEAHECWDYNTTTGIQKLESIVSLCPMCHKAKHIGLAIVKGEAESVKKHILKINNWKKEDLDKYINESFFIFDKRSDINWVLDLSYINDNFYL